MATTTTYITVRLDRETPKRRKITDEEINYLISEMDYSFTAKGDIQIFDTEMRTKRITLNHGRKNFQSDRMVFNIIIT